MLSALARRGDNVTPRPIAMRAEWLGSLLPVKEELTVEAGEVSFEALLEVVD
jgi:hypothetical protein